MTTYVVVMPDSSNLTVTVNKPELYHNTFLQLQKMIWRQCYQQNETTSVSVRCSLANRVYKM